MPRYFLVAFDEDDTVKFCILEKNKVRLPDPSQEYTVGLQVKVKWQDNNEYQGKIFGMSGKLIANSKIQHKPKFVTSKDFR